MKFGKRFRDDSENCSGVAVSKSSSESNDAASNDEDAVSDSSNKEFSKEQDAVEDSDEDNQDQSDGENMNSEEEDDDDDDNETLDSNDEQQTSLDYDDDSYEDDEDNSKEEDSADEVHSDAESEDEVEQGKGIIAQSKLYNGILSCRMKAQEAVTAMNQLPQGDNYKLMNSAGSKFEDTIRDTKCIIEKTLYGLVKLQDQLLSCRTDTEFIADQKLSSDKEDGESGVEVDMMKLISGKRKVEDYPEFLRKRQKLLNQHRDDTLEWTAKFVSTVRNNFESFESSALGQINQILLDKERLIRRTQLVRTSLPVIGKEVEEEEAVQKPSKIQKYDVEIFDDSDFYNKLLTQHVNLKTASFANMIKASQAEISKLKRIATSVDRKASKGRKTRYTVLRKLINFMMPVDPENIYSDEQRDALAREVFRGLS